MAIFDEGERRFELPDGLTPEEERAAPRVEDPQQLERGRVVRGTEKADRRRGQDDGRRDQAGRVEVVARPVAEGDLGGAGRQGLRGALNWTLQNATPAAALRFSRALWRYWSPRGRLSDGRYWLEQALSRTGEEGAPANVRADAHNALGNILGDLGEFALARGHYEAALALRRGLVDLAPALLEVERL